MNTAEFYLSLSKMNPKEAIEKFLLFNSALVIAKVKPAVTITIRNDKRGNYKNWFIREENFLKKVNLEFIYLREDENSLIVLVYNREVLKKHIAKKRNNRFLTDIGYKSTYNLDYYLNYLKVRYKKNRCPHELGIFLGIPIEDVTDFIECSNKECLICGYWKVYNNYDKAINTFKKYDEIRDKTIGCLLSGLSLDKIINSCKRLEQE